MAMGKIPSELSEINVTPFVDVMLVLLVIFMVTAPLMQHGVNVDLPKANAGTVDYKPDHLMVTVNRNGLLSLEDETVSLPVLKERLTALQKTKKDLEVYLSADHAVHYGLVVQAIAAIKEAGVSRLGMLTEPLTVTAKK